MNIYYYIALNKEAECMELCHAYGYSNQQIDTAEDMAFVLEQLVAAEGEGAFKDLLKIHPDKEVILEAFASTPASSYGLNGKSSLQIVPPMSANKRGCNGCEQRKALNATGNGILDSGSSSQTGLFIVAAALLLSVAVITRNK